ncbi:MAG: tyrosine-type recombinase/integrase [Thermoanaerobaculia bacterium]
MKIVKNLFRRNRSSKADARLTGQTTRQIRYLEKEHVEAFFDAIPVASIRDALLFDLMYRHGLRRQEATLIRREHVRDRIWIRRVKGSVSAEYPIFDRTQRLLSTYLGQVEGEGNPYLFPSRQGAGEAISTSLVYQLFQHYAAEANLPEDRRFPPCLSAFHRGPFTQRRLGSH